MPLALPLAKIHTPTSMREVNVHSSNHPIITFQKLPPFKCHMLLANSVYQPCHVVTEVASFVDVCVVVSTEGRTRRK